MKQDDFDFSPAPPAPVVASDMTYRQALVDQVIRDLAVLDELEDDDTLGDAQFFVDRIRKYQHTIQEL